MITRRSFLKGLTASTALVSVGGAVATVNPLDTARLFYGDDSIPPKGFGFAALLDKGGIRNRTVTTWAGHLTLYGANA